MVWILLAALGVPLWLCALAIVAIVVRRRKLLAREGNVPVRRRLPGKTRWSRGQAIWVHDVFAHRRSPASWSESLTWVTTVTTRQVADAGEAKELRRLGDDLVIAVMTGNDGQQVECATALVHGVDLLGPFAVEVAGQPKSARA